MVVVVIKPKIERYLDSENYENHYFAGFGEYK